MAGYTSNINLYQPDAGETGWDDEVNANADVIDNLFGATGTHNHSGAAGHGATIDLSNCGGTITLEQLPSTGVMATIYATCIKADDSGVNKITFKSPINNYGYVASYSQINVDTLNDLNDGTMRFDCNIEENVSHKTIRFGSIAAIALLETTGATLLGLGTFHKHIYTYGAFGQTSLGGVSSTIDDDDYPIATLEPNANGEIFQIPVFHDPNYTTFVVRAEVKVSDGGSALLRAELFGTVHNSETGDPPIFYTYADYDSFAWVTWNFNHTIDTGTMTTLSIYGTTSSDEANGTLYVRGLHIEALRIL
jgi:hypothetical protein